MGTKKISSRRDRRSDSGWSGGQVEWIDGNVAYISVVFSWLLSEAKIRGLQLEHRGYNVKIGGPAIDCNPDFMFPRWIDESLNISVLSRHNPLATFTTRGCIRNCPFCIVPKIEGNLIELSDDEWCPNPIICDNNILGASMNHFNHVIDRLIKYKIKDVDFNQGLDARLLTAQHVVRLRELHKLGALKVIRLAWDSINMESYLRQAYNLLCGGGIPKSKLRCYVLIGFNDTPEDALYRLETLWKELKVLPNPMRYQPLNTPRRNAYVHPNWTDWELKKYMRYWSRLRYLSGIPFEKYEHSYKQKQMSLF